jgi:formylglycine-generating enzyme required for sulfatase activity
MKTLQALKTNIEWIKVPSGVAVIGSSLEEIERAHEYWLPRLLDPKYPPKFRDWLMKEYPKFETEVEAFEISDILVTNEMYRLYVEDTGARVPESLWNKEYGGEDDHPVWGVTFEEALAYCRWHSEQVGYEVGLPTEIQWEYAARGGTNREYPWGDTFEKGRCNTIEEGIGGTTPVRHYESGRSPFGLYDMGGNVEEWVDTLYWPYEGGKIIVDDLVEALGEKYPLLRGGSFARGGDLARTARRHGGAPHPVFRFTGFRLVKKGGGGDA